MPNVEVAGSGTTGWLCTIQPLPANDTSGLCCYSMHGAATVCTRDEMKILGEGLVSVIDPAAEPALFGQNELLPVS